MVTRTIYGPGGFDPSKPNNNIIAQEEVDADPVPDAPLLSVEERLVELEREVRGMKDRAAAAQVTGDARKVRDAVVGE